MSRGLIASSAGGRRQKRVEWGGMMDVVSTCCPGTALNVVPFTLQGAPV